MWTAEYDAFNKRSLADRDFVYVWADGVHFRIRLEDELLDMAQARWRKVTAPHLVPLVRAGVPFKDGVRVERSPDPTPTIEEAAA